MDYKIVEKEQFTIIGVSKVLGYDEAATEVPKLWMEYSQTGKSDIVCSVYGVSIIPKHTWAVFASKGAMPHSLQDVYKKFFSEWLPNCKDYQIAAGYNIEMYSDPAEYTKGMQDEKYYSEIWVPVRQKYEL